VQEQDSLGPPLLFTKRLGQLYEGGGFLPNETTDKDIEVEFLFKEDFPHHHSRLLLRFVQNTRLFISYHLKICTSIIYLYTYHYILTYMVKNYVNIHKSNSIC